jgi:hypothetical protein
MAMDPLAIFDLAALKAYCKVTSSEQDTVLELIGNAASAYCEARTGWVFKRRSITERRHGDDTHRLLRLQAPLLSVTSLTIDGVALAPSEYVALASGKVLLTARSFSPGIANVTIVYDAGYDNVATGRADVYLAALDLAKSAYDEWQNGAVSIASISVGPATAMIRPGLNPRIEKFLDAIRDVRA